MKSRRIRVRKNAVRPRTVLNCRTRRISSPVAVISRTSKTQQLLSTMYKLTRNNCRSMAPSPVGTTTMQIRWIDIAWWEEWAGPEIACLLESSILAYTSQEMKKSTDNAENLNIQYRVATTGNCCDVRLMTSHSVIVTSMSNINQL